jgi:hypothetical protein
MKDLAGLPLLQKRRLYLPRDLLKAEFGGNRNERKENIEEERNRNRLEWRYLAVESPVIVVRVDCLNS